MKKKLFSILLAMLLFVPFFVSAKEDKVKVYIFEAGGCPYCEAEVEYLKSLDSYNKKFTIEVKELYVDHVDWEIGKDFELGKKVAEAFNEVGFTEASYQGTPFVVISDVYAKSVYSESLESIIDEVYEKGDKDIVSCYADGNDDCLDHLKETDAPTATTTSTSNSWVVIVMSLAIIVTIIVKSTFDTNKIVEAINSNKKEVSKNNKSNKK